MKSIRNFIKSLYYPDKNFYKLVFSMAIPIACQNLITIGVNLTDTLMQGMLGETQLSASSLATQFVNMFQIFVMGTSMGASVLAARYWGMREMKSLKKTIAIMIRILMTLATVFAAITFFAPEWIMKMYSNEPEIISEGVRYLEYAVLTYFLHGLSLGSTIILRSVGKVKVSLIVSIGAFVTNIFGNYIFMFGKLGMPQMGIAGASFATLLVRVFECIFNFGYLIAVEKDVKFRPKDLLIKAGDLVGEYIRISIPVLISDSFLAFGNNTVMMIVGRMGERFVAANAIAAVVERMSTTGISGVGQASAMITGKTLGEGDREKVQRQGMAFFGVGMLLGCFASILILLISEPVIAIYHLENETAAIARQLLWASSIMVLFQASNGILTKGTLRGGGDTKVLMIADSIFLWVVSVPLGYLSGLVLGWPAFWVYFFLKSENICKTIWGVARLRSGKWIKKIKSFG